jgi:hypothetical protein
MTRLEVLKKAREGKITWRQAADICRLTPRHLRRLRVRYALCGAQGLREGRAGRHMPHGISSETVEERRSDTVCRSATR